MKKLINCLTITSLILMGSQAIAKKGAEINSCLKRASNQDLISEIASRMNDGGDDGPDRPGRPRMFLHASCSGSFANFKLLNDQFEQTDEESAVVSGGGISCSEFISDFVIRKPVRHGFSVYMCSGSFLETHVVLDSGKFKEIESEVFGPNCLSEAVRRNKASSRHH